MSTKQANDIYEMKKSSWLRRESGIQMLYPRDSYKVLSVWNGVVEYHRDGGGPLHRIGLTEFHEKFREVTEEEIEHACHPDLAFFSFDWGPSILGFTYGDRWNGWGCPYLEKESLREWIRKMYTDEDEWRFELQGDGTLRSYREKDDADDCGYDTIAPQQLEFQGRTFEVYYLGMQFTWDQVDLEDLGAASGITLQECMEAIYPEGIDMSGHFEALEIIPAPPSDPDMISYLEMARIACAAIPEELSDLMDLSDDEYTRLRDKLQLMMTAHQTKKKA